MRTPGTRTVTEMPEWFPWLVTAASVVGTVANSLQKRWCFWIWLCTNAFWAAYNAARGQWAQALLYLFNLAMALLGLAKWRKKAVSQPIVISSQKGTSRPKKASG